MLFIKKKAKDAEILAAKEAEKAQVTENVQEAPKIEMVKCPKCGREVEKERVKNAKYICYECGSYFRVKTKNRIRMVTDPKSFEPWFEDMPGSNPLGTEGYEEKVAAAQAKTNLKEAVTIGKATINGEPAVVGVCDARFLMSSMGYVVGIVILEELEHAKARGAKIYAELSGYGCSSDAYHITAPEESGEGPAVAMTNAVKDAGLPLDAVQYINAHGTSTHLNDLVETRAIKKAFGDHAKDIKINSTKSMTGHLLGAAGAIECIACVKSIEEGYIHRTRGLIESEEELDLDYCKEPCEMDVDVAISNSLGFGGHNACIVLQKYKEQ